MEEMRRFKAKFAGKCCKCRGQFPAGTEILYWPLSKDAAHVECPKVNGEEQAAIFSRWVEILTNQP